MRLRTMIVMLLMVVTGLVYIFLVERRLTPDRRDGNLLGRIIRFEPEQTHAFEIVSSVGTLRCIMTENEWRIVDPINAKADSSEVNRFLDALRRLESKTVITRAERLERGLTVADYGLVPPRAVLKLEGERFKRLINVGGLSTDGNAVYIACDNAKENVFSVDPGFLDSVPVHASKLRSRLIFDVEPKAVSRVEVKTSDGFMSLVLDSASVWMMQQPLVARADGAKVEKLIDALCRLRIVDFLPDATPETAIYGFDEVDSMVALKGVDDVLAAEVYFGMPIPEQPDMIYAHFKGDDSVFVLPRATLDALGELKPRDLRERRLVNTQVGEVAAVRLGEDSSMIEMLREADVWKMVSPRSWSVDHERVTALVSALLSTRIHDFIPFGENTGWGSAFATNSISVSLATPPSAGTGNGAKRPRKWVDMELRTSLDEPAYIGVKRADADWIYLVPKELMDFVRMQALYYRDREVLALRPENIQSIRLKTSDGEQVVERNEQGEFATRGVEAGTETTLYSQQARTELLRSVRCREFISSAEFSPAEYGLDNPGRTLTLLLSGDGGISKSLLVGDARRDGSFYAQVRGQDVVFILDDETVETLCSDLYSVAAPSEE